MTAAELALEADAHSPGAARRFLLAHLHAWGHAEYGEDATLVISELVTNATLHAKTAIVVRVELLADCLRLGVTDGSPRQPAVRHYSQQSTTGRGLALISALTRRWGIEPLPDGGKTVWAELSAAPAARRPEDTTAEARVTPGARTPAPNKSSSAGAGEATSRVQVA